MGYDEYDDEPGSAQGEIAARCGSWTRSPEPITLTRAGAICSRRRSLSA